MRTVKLHRHRQPRLKPNTRSISTAGVFQEVRLATSRMYGVISFSIIPWRVESIANPSQDGHAPTKKRPLYFQRQPRSKSCYTVESRNSKPWSIEGQVAIA